MSPSAPHAAARSLVLPLAAGDAAANAYVGACGSGSAMTLSAALAAAGANGTVCLADGDWTYTTALTLPAGLTLTGAGTVRGRFTANGSLTTTGISLAPSAKSVAALTVAATATNAVLTGITIANPGGFATTTGILVAAGGVTITAPVIAGVATGINGGDTAGLKVTDPTIQVGATSGITLGAGATNAEITGGTFTAATDGKGTGIAAGAGSGHTIFGAEMSGLAVGVSSSGANLTLDTVTVTGTSTGGGTAALLSQTTGAAVLDCVFTDLAYGIRGDYMTDLTVTDSTINNTTSNAIWAAGLNGAEISGCTFEGNDTVANFDAKTTGTAPNYTATTVSQGVVFSGNTLTDNGGGVYFPRGAKDSEFMNNTVTGTTVRYVVAIAAGHDITVSGNTFDVASGPSVVISGVYMDVTDETGAHPYCSTGILLDGNELTGAGPMLQVGSLPGAYFDNRVVCDTIRFSNNTIPADSVAILVNSGGVGDFEGVVVDATGPNIWNGTCGPDVDEDDFFGGGALITEPEPGRVTYDNTLCILSATPTCSGYTGNIDVILSDKINSVSVTAAGPTSASTTAVAGLAKLSGLSSGTYQVTATFGALTTPAKSVVVSCPSAPVEATPLAVGFVAPTCQDGKAVPGSYTIPAVAGVEYLIDGQVVAPGTYTVEDDRTVEVSARATTGYVLAITPVPWTLVFTQPTDCRASEAITAGTPVLPSLTRAATCQDTAAIYTPATTEGVDYYVDGTLVTTWFTLEHGATATVVAQARTGYVLPDGTQSMTLGTLTPQLDPNVICRTETATPIPTATTPTPIATTPTAPVTIPVVTSTEPTDSPTAPVTTAPSPGATDGGQSAVPTSSNDQAAGGKDNPSLPVTGADPTPILLVVALLLAAGAAGVWLRRRAHAG